MAINDNPEDVRSGEMGERGFGGASCPEKAWVYWIVRICRYSITNEREHEYLHEES
jgi:hypothetical protein